MNKNKIFIFLIVVMMACSAFFFYLIYKSKKFNNNNQQVDSAKNESLNQNQLDEIHLDIENSLVVTLAEHLVYFDAEKSILEGIKKIDEYDNFYHSQFNSNDKLVYSVGDSRIFILDRKASDGEILEIKEEIYKPENFSWSKDGNVLLYQALIENEEPPVLPENWYIFSNDFNGKNTLIVQGSNPFFINEKRIIFLKSDGIYMFNLELKEESLIWKSEKNTLLDSNKSKIKASKNSSKLVLFDGEGLFLFDVGNSFISGKGLDDPRKVEIDSVVDLYFSNQGELVVKRKTTQDFLEVYNVETLKKMYQIE